MECHAFLCPRRKMAQSATLTIAQAFNLAFECWKVAQEKRKRVREKLVENYCSCGCGRKDKKDEKCGVEEANVSLTSSGYISSDAHGEKEEGGVEEHLLIDLSSPGKVLKKPAGVISR